MGTHRLTVALPGRAYSIHIGSGLIRAEGQGALLPRLRGRRGVIVSNDKVAPLYLQRVREWLAVDGYEAEAIILPDGESNKNAENLFRLYQAIYQAGLQRNGFICALGGGVVGDLAGFAAATYMRGIDLVQLPTTLLAQVDSAIGGKNGINLKVGKNLIGTTYQPRVVISDVDFLASLPPREILCGLGEVVKYGLLGGDDFISFLELNRNDIFALKPRALSAMIHTCSRIKADYVVRDEFDQIGVRAALNFGHTVGHALEKFYGFERYAHGEAVALGMVCALELSRAAKMLSTPACARAMALIESFGLPQKLPADADPDALIELMRRDKKAGTSLTMVLLKGLGDPHLEENIEVELLREVLSMCRAAV